jgi:hypothetical protein
MFRDLSIHDALLARSILNGREEMYLFIAMVFLNTAMPSKAVGYEVWVIRSWETRSLLVDAVEASD